MKEKVLFEIPIYSMSKEDFEKKWDNYFKDGLEHSSEHYKEAENRKEYLETARGIYFPRTEWKYNQIIGYVQIKLANKDIIFGYYGTTKAKINFKNKERNFLKNMQLIGYHFIIKDTWNNDIIKKEIIKWLNDFEKNELENKFFIEKSTFLEQLKYMDIKKAIEDFQC